MSNKGSVTLDYINKAMHNINILRKQMKVVNSEESIVCFRGESQDYGKTKLMPSLFRINEGYMQDKGLIELLSDYGIPNSLDESLLSKSIAGQHFVSTSRLLDITFSVLPSLYFASENFKEDGYVYSFVFPESFSPNSEYLNFYYNRIVEQDFFPFSRDFKVITHSYNNERIKLQSGGFLLFSGNTFNKVPEDYYNEPIKIKAKDKEIIREELAKYFNITEATIYPEKDKRKIVIEKRLKSKIGSRNLRSKDYVKEEFDYYLRRIKFEISVKISKEISSIDVKRFLRTERANVIKYIERNFKNEEFLEKEKYINIQFKLMEKNI